MARAGLTKKRLTGLDRSGGPPPQTLKGAPLNPWTIPNAIGYVRAILIPVFLVTAFSSDDGTDPLPVVLFAIISWGDYADGIAARITGQYSRLGAIMDPVVDRLLILSGLVVVWHFDLVPRELLALLVLREALMLFGGRYAFNRGVDVVINWPGRIAVFPVMSAIFFGMCGLREFATGLLIVGLVLAWWATALYIRHARRQLASGPAPSTEG